MAKRRHGSEAELPFVALMDTMTNVVGVLTIVLVMMGISLSRAVHLVTSNLPPATAQQVAETQASLDTANQEEARLKNELASLGAAPDAGSINADIGRLEQEVKDKNIKLFDLDSLNKELAARNADLDQKKKSFDTLVSERDRMKALLDSTPILKAPEGKVVRIPNTKDIPPGAIIYLCYITGNQAHLLDPVAAKKMVMDEFERHRGDFRRQTIHVKGAKDRAIYDQEKIVAYFAKLNLTVRKQKITVPYNKQSNVLTFHIEFDPSKGDASLDDMLQPNGRFHSICYKVQSFYHAVLIFKVRPDGFETYLKAREIADSYNIPCGWDIDGSNLYWEVLPFEVNPLEAPPPPGPAPTGPPPPPPPKTRID